MDDSEKNVYKFDYYHWGKIVHDVKLANELKYKQMTEENRKRKQERSEIYIEIARHPLKPDALEITNNKTEHAVNKKSGCCLSFRNFFFRKKNNVT